MSLKIVENLKEIIKNKKLRGAEVKMAVAYIHNKGLKIFCDVLKVNPSKVTISRNFHMSETAALKRLEGIVRYYDGDFHAKLYLFTSKNGQKISILGSSNLSEHGWEKNIEGNLITDDKNIVNEIEKIIDGCWEKAKPMSKEMLIDLGQNEKKYKGTRSRWRTENEKIIKKYSKPTKNSEILAEIISFLKGKDWTITKVPHRPSFRAEMGDKYIFLTVHSTGKMNPFNKKKEVDMEICKEDYNQNKIRNAWMVVIDSYENRNYGIPFSKIKITGKAKKKNFYLYKIYTNDKKWFIDK